MHQLTVMAGFFFHSTRISNGNESKYFGYEPNLYTLHSAQVLWFVSYVSFESFEESRVIHTSWTKNGTIQMEIKFQNASTTCEELFEKAEPEGGKLKKEGRKNEWNTTRQGRCSQTAWMGRINTWNRILYTLHETLKKYFDWTPCWCAFHLLSWHF